MKYLIKFLVLILFISIGWSVRLPKADFVIIGGVYDGYILDHTVDGQYYYVRESLDSDDYLRRVDDYDYEWACEKRKDGSYRYNDRKYKEYFKNSIFYRYSQREIGDFPPYTEIQNLKYASGGEGGNKLAAGSKGYIEFDIFNKGRGPAYNLICIIDIKKNAPELSFEAASFVDVLAPGEHVHIKFPITAKISAESKFHRFTVSVREYFGFDADDKIINVEVFEISTPEFIVDSIEIDDDQEGNSLGNSNGVIEKGETIELNIKIKNTGRGIAENFRAELILDEKLRGFFLPKSNNRVYTQDAVNPGEVLEMSLYFYTNKKVKKGKIPLSLEVTEKTGEFSLTQELNLDIKEMSNY